MMNELWLCRIGNVVNTKATLVVRLLFRSLNLHKVGLGDIELLREFGTAWLAAEWFAQVAPHPRQLLGTPPDRRRITLMVDNHQIANDADLVAMRGRVVERHCRDKVCVLRIRD